MKMTAKRAAMSGEILSSRLYYRVCCLVLFCVAASASFYADYQQSHFAEVGVPGANTRATFESMVEGTAYRPYVYRQMLPNIANWLDRIAPVDIKTAMYDHQGSNPYAYINAIGSSPTARNKAYFFRYVVVYIETYLFAVLAVYAMYLVCSALEMRPPAAVIAPVVVILLVPYIISGRGYLWDYPELAFLALAFWIALKWDWWWVIPVAVLGTWNKESFLLIIPTLYPIFRLRSSRFRALLGVGVLCLVCAAVYIPIRLKFANNPGSTVFVSWQYELHMLLHPIGLLFKTKETYGLRMITGYTLLPAALMAWTVWRAWPHLPRAIQRHGQIAAAINIPLYLLFCSPGELRDLSMLYIFFLLVIATNLNEWVGGTTTQDQGLLHESQAKQGSLEVAS